MFALHMDSKAILVCLFASKQETHRIVAYSDIFARLAAAHRQPMLYIWTMKPAQPSNRQWPATTVPCN